MDEISPHPKQSEFDPYHLSVRAKCRTLVYAIFSASLHLYDEYAPECTEDGLRVSWEVDGMADEDDHCPSIRLREVLYAEQPVIAQHVAIDAVVHSTITYEPSLSSSLGIRAYVLEHTIKRYDDEEEKYVSPDWQPMTCFVISVNPDGTATTDIIDPHSGVELDEFSQIAMYQWLTIMLESIQEELKDFKILTDPEPLADRQEELPFAPFIPAESMVRYSCGPCRASGVFCIHCGQLN